MPIISAKRQITIPIDMCREAGLAPGDEYECLIADGRVTIIRKQAGAAAGILSQVKGDPTVTDDESLASALEDQHP